MFSPQSIINGLPRLARVGEIEGKKFQDMPMDVSTFFLRT
jgi:hypothetical protein